MSSGTTRRRVHCARSFTPRAYHSPEGGREAKGKVSHAHARRRDLRRAFGLDAWDDEKKKYVQVREPTARERQLFDGDDRIRKVDFHSCRRAFATALRRAKVDARDAMRLSAHTSFETHQKYVQDDGPILAPPAAALPLLPAVSPILRVERSVAAATNVVEG